MRASYQLMRVYLDGQSPRSGTSQFNLPAGIFVDSANHIYIADTNNYRIIRMDDMTGAGWQQFHTSRGPEGVFVHP